jgi:hypothetical protein
LLLGRQRWGKQASLNPRLTRPQRRWH